MVDAAMNDGYEEIIRVYNKAKFKTNEHNKRKEIIRNYM